MPVGKHFVSRGIDMRYTEYVQRIDAHRSRIRDVSFHDGFPLNEVNDSPLLWTYDQVS